MFSNATKYLNQVGYYPFTKGGAPMNTDVVEEIKKFVEEECKKPTSKYGYDAFLNHFVQTVKYAKLLAEKLNADTEIVELASWLHDIGSIINGRKNHHITGAKIAEKKLKELNYPEDKIEKVKPCIISHCGSQNINRNTREAQIIAEADAMSAFGNVAGGFKAAFVYEKLSQEEARDSVRQKLTNSFNKLSPTAKKIMKPKYGAAMLLLT